MNSLSYAYSTFANDAKPYLRCRSPTRSQPQPTVPSPLWFLCSRRQKSYPEVARLNVHKPNSRQSISLLTVDEVITGTIPQRIFMSFKNLLKSTNFETESYESSNYTVKYSIRKALNV